MNNSLIIGVFSLHKFWTSSWLKIIYGVAWKLVSTVQVTFFVEKIIQHKKTLLKNKFSTYQKVDFYWKNMKENFGNLVSLQNWQIFICQTLVIFFFNNHLNIKKWIEKDEALSSSFPPMILKENLNSLNTMNRKKYNVKTTIKYENILSSFRSPKKSRELLEILFIAFGACLVLYEL